MAALVAIVGLCGCAKPQKAEEAPADSPKTLVCYFSATGTTQKAAERLADLTGATLYEITPEDPYSDADLDWNNKNSRSYLEMHTPGSRPAVKAPLPNLAQYDTIFIGYPNWWNTHPTIINTFIEANNLEGKVIVPFMTSGGSDLKNSEKELRATYPDLKFANGLLMNHVSDKEIEEWLNNL